MFIIRFKKGAFQIAKSAGVRIVPVSIGNLFRLMPKQAILPIAHLRYVFKYFIQNAYSIMFIWRLVYGVCSNCS